MKTTQTLDLSANLFGHLNLPGRSRIIINVDIIGPGKTAGGLKRGK